MGVAVTEPGALCGVPAAAPEAGPLLGVGSFEGVDRGCDPAAVMVVVRAVVGVLAGEDVLIAGGLPRVLGERAERRVWAGRARSR